MLGENMTHPPWSTKAGVVFPVARVENGIRARQPCYRVSPRAAVFLAAVLEYVTAELLELAGNTARCCRRRRVTPSDVLLASREDVELLALLRGAVIPGACVPQFLLDALRPRTPPRKATLEDRERRRRERRMSLGLLVVLPPEARGAHMMGGGGDGGGSGPAALQP